MTLLEALGPQPKRVLDIGGGFGEQAARLASAGHSVVILDPDPTLLREAERRVSAASIPSGAVSIIEGTATEAPDVTGGGFDLVCCHSVLMYMDDAAPVVNALVASVCVGGLLSILSVNPDSLAMRAGLQQRWSEATEVLRDGSESAEHYLPNNPHSLALVVRLLQDSGAAVKDWTGVRVFTDHLAEREVDSDELHMIVEAERLAGERDPYRQVARLFHVMAVRNR